MDADSMWDLVTINEFVHWRHFVLGFKFIFSHKPIKWPETQICAIYVCPNSVRMETLLIGETDELERDDSFTSDTVRVWFPTPPIPADFIYSPGFCLPGPAESLWHPESHTGAELRPGLCAPWRGTSAGLWLAHTTPEDNKGRRRYWNGNV